ncbi:PaaI family thioesterase [Gillisia marina]|uniref:PaaI family thioesterase n=1 Tax=Gillisia marina TaxID=1167637 RepID=UPI00029ADC57|nr:PaaI family thioesterase [Gillisia marina]
MEFKPKTANYKQKVTDSFNAQKFMDFIGATLVEVKPGFCEIHLPYKEELTQQNGFFHAGIISTLADNATGYAAFSLMEEDAAVLAVEFKLNLMSPGVGEKLVAKANVLKSGRTLTICRADVFAVKDGVEKLCAASQATLIQIKISSTEKTEK